MHDGPKAGRGSTAVDRLGLHAALAMFACALMASSGPASAYFVDETRFADGSPTFSTTITGRWDMGGPGLRLFTNSSVIEATMVVEGGPHRVTQNVLETSSVDFSSNLGASGVRIASGSLSLDQSTGAVVLNAANAFSVDSSTGVAVFGENLTLDNASAGSLLTSNLSAPPAGWGHLSLLGHLPAGSSLSVDLLSPTGALLVASQAVGTRINLDALAYPLVRLSLSIDAPSPLQSPQIREITLGQRVADSFAFSSPTHTVSDLVPTPTGALTQVANTASLSRAPQNPLLNVAPSTFYSETVHVPQVIRVGSEWWAYFMGTNINGATQGQIGLAVSTDLTTWTVRPTPVLSATPGSWAATSLSEPFVMRDPDSSGYLMFFEGWNATPIGIGLAFSPDGINWTQFAGNPVITPTAATWDSGFVGEIAHVEVVNGTWRLWYSGRVPGGFRQLGMSSSSDGRNWTKYAGNPVISPTPGGPDAEEAASGTIAMVNGSYLMYYSCTPGMTGFGICMATSTDGVSWAKAARAVLTATGGWEGADIAVGSVVQYNGTLSLFYEGFQNGVIRSGRADAVWSEGTVTTVTDLGAGSPYALLTLSESGSVPPGGSLQVLLSSSPDGVSWSPFENMSAKTAIQTTPANRFVRSLITLRAPVRTNAAVLRSTALSYSDLSLVGIYNSSLFAHSMPAVAVTPTLTLGASSDPVTLRLSNDGGTTWEPAASGVAHVFSSSGATVAYSLDFEPVAGRSPVVDAVELAIELESWPANVTLRLGATAAPFANLSGPLVGAVTVAWPVDELNALIAAAASQPSPPSAITVGTWLRSDQNGTVTVRALALRYLLKNPLAVSFSPPGGEVSVNENATATFGVTATSYPPEAAVNTSWFLDDVEVASSRGQAGFAFLPNFTQAGLHRVRCAIENGDFMFQMTWDVTVVNVNRPPSIDSSIPPGGASSVFRGTAVSFAVTASDPDGASLFTYGWSLDGVPQLAFTDPSATFSALTAGHHTIAVTVGDGESSVTWPWTVEVVNRAPTVSRESPTAEVVERSHRALGELAVVAADPDGDDLTYSWSVDGSVVSAASGAVLTVPPLAAGAHRLVATVSDGIATASVSWTVTALNGAPVVVSRDPVNASSTAAPQSFSVVATDPDGGPLHYVWSIDGVAQSVAGATYATPGNLAPGPHTVTVAVTDELGLASPVTWTFSTPTPPGSTLIGDSGTFLILALALVAGAAAALFMVARKRRAQDGDAPPRPPSP